MEEISAAAARETRPSFLHMDARTNILLRIPAKHLVKLKTVCKSWYKLTTSQSFMRSHLNHWTSWGINGFAVQSYCNIDGSPACTILYFTMHLNCEEGKFQCHNFLIRNCSPYLREIQSIKELQLLASYVGLLLIGYAEETHCQFLIYNPIMGSYRRLPVFQLSDDIYFGYDPCIFSEECESAMGMQYFHWTVFWVA